MLPSPQWKPVEDVLRVITELNRAAVDYVVVGGVALNVHGLVRSRSSVAPRTLYRMKRDTVRPIDHSDAAALRVAFNLEDP